MRAVTSDRGPGTMDKEAVNRLWRWIVLCVVTALIVGYALGALSLAVLYDAL